MVVVKIASYQIGKYSRRLTRPWKTSRGEVYNREGLLLRLISDKDLVAFGEAAPLQGYSTESLSQTEDALRAASQGLINKIVPSSNEEIAALTADLIKIIPSASFALESALSDLAAKNTGIILSKWLNPLARQSIAVNYVSSDFRDLKQLEKDIDAGGYSVIKIKVGVNSPDDEIRDIIKLLEILPENVEIRIDANQAFTFDQACRFFDNLPHDRIDYIEEPLKEYNPDLYARFKSTTGLRFTPDESLAGKSLDSVLKDNLFDPLIIKPSLIGGIYKSLELGRKAHLSGSRIVITSMLESEIGLATLCHLAAAMPDNLLPSGLDTIRIFENSDAVDFAVSNGQISVPCETDGIGIIIDRLDWIKELSWI